MMALPETSEWVDDGGASECGGAASILKLAFVAPIAMIIIVVSIRILRKSCIGWFNIDFSLRKAAVL